MLTPQELELPEKFKTWKGQQEDVIEKIVLSNKHLYLLDAPTGSGKSVIGIAASYIWRTNWLVTRRLEGEDVEDRLPKRVIYVTHTKDLQKQLLREFPNARMIKGRDNYPCALALQRFPDFTADDCPYQSHPSGAKACPHLALCPYLLAKHTALHAEIAVLNESYYLAEANGPGQFSGADFVILDEIDCMENTLMNHISIEVPLSTLEEFELQPPPNVEDWRTWIEWWNHTSTTRTMKAHQMTSQVNLLGEKISDKDIKTSRRLRRLINFNDNLTNFIRDTLVQLMGNPDSRSIEASINDTIAGKETPFVASEYKSRKNGALLGWQLKPVSVRGFAPERLWRHAERFLGMSGTILSPVVQTRELGYKEDDYDYRQIPSPFALKNRPIFYWPVADMRKRNVEQGLALPVMLNAVNRIIEKYPDKKGLIHTASYPLASAIRHDQVDLRESSRLIWHDTETRSDQMDKFKAAKEPLVMVSPSFDRGVDLPDDQCRFIIIAKVPYLNIGDKQVAARLKAAGGDQWYVFKAIQSIMQMSGRGVRHENDHCDTYILDAGFESLLARTGTYIPKWWYESIRRIEDLSI